MRKRALLVVAVLMLVALGVQPVLAISWGDYDDPSNPEYPHVGAIIVYYGQWGWTTWCSGTLVHERVFLSAGHCTVSLDSMGYEPEDVWASFDAVPAGLGGGDPEYPDPSWIGVEEMITHPDYGPAASNPRDVGALILAEPVTGITPANLPYEGFLDDLRKEGELRQGSTGAKFTVVGYGATLSWPPPEIYYEEVRQFAQSEYQTLLKKWLRMSQNQATGDGGTCFGDSGGPAFWTDPDTGEEVLVGITSWGDAVCVASGFNYRVDIPETLEFIQSVIPNSE